MSSRDRIAQMLATRTPQELQMAGSPASLDSQGLQQPAIDPVMMMSMAAGPSIARALAGVGQMAPKMAMSQAGALFPEGVDALPATQAAAQEMGSVLPESRINYLRNLANSQFHAQNNDWPRVLADKWALLKNAGGN